LTTSAAERFTTRDIGALEHSPGWPNGEMRCNNKLGRCDARYCEYGGYRNPKERAMQFFGWMMDGKDAESFFGDIIAA
jgi:hypothetical protein